MIFRSISIAAVLGASAIFMYAESINLVQNGDFESVADEMPAGWTIAPYGSKNAVPTIANDGNIRGKVSAHLKHENEAAVHGAKAIVLITSAKIAGIVSGTEYRFRFAARSPIAGQTITVYYYTDPSVSPHFYKLKKFTILDPWQQYDFILKLPPEAEWKDRALYMRFDISFGEVYLDDVVFEVNPNEAPTAAFPARAAIPGRKNLMQNSSFEIGCEEYALSRAMYLRGRDANDTEAQQPVIDTDEKMYGVSSLRLESPNGDGLLLSSRDIPITPGKKYTLSASFKTAGDIKIVSLSILSVLESGKRKDATVWSEVRGDWKRISVTFDAAPNHYFYTLQIQNIAEGYGKQPPPTRHQAGTMWVDGIQLCEGTSSKYEPDDFEIGVMLPTNRYYAFTPNEPYPIRFKALNNTAASAEVKFKYSVRDKYFDKVVKTGETTAVVLRANGIGEVSENINPGRYGMFAMDYELVNAKAGTLLDAYSFDYAVIENLMAKPIPKGFTSGGQGNFRANWFAMSWATQPTLAYHGATIAETYDFLANVGDRWYRCWDFGWGHNEIDEGNYEWQVIDRQVEEFSRRGMKIVASFDTLIVDEKNPQSIYAHVPKWALERYGVSDAKGSMKCRVTVPPVEIWARYFTACVARYKGKVRAYEIFNEPNLWLSPEQYTPFLKAAYEIVRANDPDALVVGFCATGDLGGYLLKFVKGCLRLGAKDYYDVLSFHPYDSMLDSSSYPAEKQIAGIRAALDEVGDTAKQIWNSELFYLEDDLPEYFYGSLDVKGHQFARRLLIDQFHGLERSSCLDAGYNRARIAPLAHDLGRKPIPSQFYVINNAWARFFEGGKPLKQTPLVGKNKLYAYQRPDGPVAAYWNFSYETGQNSAVTFKNAAGKILFFDLMGNPLERSPSDGGYRIDATVDPVYIRPNSISIDEFLAVMRTAEMEFKVPFTVSCRMEYRDGSPVIIADVMNYQNQITPMRVSFTAAGGELFPSKSVDVEARARGETMAIVPVTVGKPWTTADVSFRIDASGKRYDIPQSFIHFRPLAAAVSAKPVIDGTVNTSEWNNTPAIVLNSIGNLRNAVPAVWGGVNDFSGKVWLSWDNDSLYIGLKVLDDKRGERGSLSGVWNSDCIELFIDTAPEEQPTASGFNANTCQLVIGLPTEKFPDVFVAKANGLLEVNAAAMSVKTALQPEGYDCEIAIPFKELGCRPQAGKQLGFDICLSDDDVASRKLSLVWAGDADYYRSRLHFGRVVLSAPLR